MKNEFGKKHEIVRAHIDALTSGSGLRQTHDTGNQHAEMLYDVKKIGFVSDVTSAQTLYAMMQRLPTHLRQK